MWTPWRSKSSRSEPARTVYVGSHEDRLARLPAIRVDPDYDEPNREDRERERAERASPFLICMALALLR